MPNIKPEASKKIESITKTLAGEMLCVAIFGAFSWALCTVGTGCFLRYFSQLVYPFSYCFISHEPLDSFLPDIIKAPSLSGGAIFGSIFTLAVYYFEKNIFYRRFALALKAIFASVCACAMVFIGSLLCGLLPYMPFYIADPASLPLLFLYYYLASVPVFALCAGIRRNIFLLP